VHDDIVKKKVMEQIGCVRFYRFRHNKIRREDYLEDYLITPYGENLISLLRKRKDIIKFLNENLFEDMGFRIRRS